MLKNKWSCIAQIRQLVSESSRFEKISNHSNKTTQTTNSGTTNSDKKPRNDKLYKDKYNITSITEHYYPDKLLPLEKIKFVNNEAKLHAMLEFFKRANPDIIGLDCEWKFVAL